MFTLTSVELVDTDTGVVRELGSRYSSFLSSMTNARGILDIFVDDELQVNLVQYEGHSLYL